MLKTTTLNTEGELANLLQQTLSKDSRSNELLAYIKNAKIDFSQESLVLITYISGTSDVDVKLLNPHLSGKTFNCTIDIDGPLIGNCSEVPFCFPVIVRKKLVQKVQVKMVEKVQENISKVHTETLYVK